MASKVSCKRSGVSSGGAHGPGLGCHGRREEQLRGREDRHGDGVEVREAGDRSQSGGGGEQPLACAEVRLQGARAAAARAQCGGPAVRGHGLSVWVRSRQVWAYSVQGLVNPVAPW